MTVTIEVPASQPTIRRPEGQPGGSDTLAETLYTAASRYEEFADEADQLLAPRGFSGQGQNAYQAAGGKAAGEHRAMATTVERVARAVTAYADTLRDLLREWQELSDRQDVLDDRRTALIADINATTDATEAQIAALRERASALAADYAELVTDHDGLHRRVRANEDLLRQVFESATSLDEALSADGGVPEFAQQAMDRPGAPGSGATPEETRAWWEDLSEAEREAVVSSYPGLVGSADGLPADARDQANRVLLDDDLATLGSKADDGLITPAEQKVLDNARAAQQAMADADSFEDPITGERPGGQLWLYDPSAFDGDGRVAVAVGDLDTADDVAVFTPGITTEMSDVPGYTDQMQNLYESTRYNGDGSSVATMFWLGYNTPEGAIDWDTMTEGRAADGGERLADAVDGLRASRPDDPAHMTAIGHSYGSTTTSYAAADHDLDVDDVALIGSPGAGPADHASDFSVGQEHVYVGRDSRDFVAVLGDEGWIGKGGLGLGTDPSSEDFDATRFESEREDRGSTRLDGDAHSSYLAHDTESLYNLGLIVDGHGDQVNTASQSYDPWYDVPQDPEWDRDPSSGVPGQSQTRDPGQP
ncbi:alpha/beta hydrolase [Nocardioides ferulae]|uniref:alpha/beta hydrolase n=1 Tax=Nocardioides ferulae TaxID=2340821 RepID=UPI000EAE2D79|nr:alpha/beta hydrolase [Nocardioides ferulae]